MKSLYMVSGNRIVSITPENEGVFLVRNSNMAQERTVQRSPATGKCVGKCLPRTQMEQYAELKRATLKFPLRSSTE